MKRKKFLIFADQGQGSGPNPYAFCYSLRRALLYVEKHKAEASFAIKMPNGKYYKWKW